MKTLKRLCLATTAGLLFGGLNCAFADVQRGQISNTDQFELNRPDVVIDRSNYKQLQKDGLHLFPGEIVAIKGDHHLIYPKSGIHQSLDQISFGKTSLYRAREFGSAGQVAVEGHAVIPFYGLWMLSAMNNEHVFTAVVDKPDDGQRISLKKTSL